MRVAYICADAGVPVFGSKGCSVHVQEMVRALIEQGADVELFAGRRGGDPPHDLAGVRMHPLCSSLPADLEARELALLEVNDTLRRLLDDCGPFDLVYERHALWSHAGQEWAKESGIPSILEVNAPLIQEQEQHRGLRDRDRADWAARRAFAAATALVAVSHGVAAHLCGYEETKGRVHVIPNGIRPARFPADVPPARERRDDVFTIGFVGSLKPWHGLTTLLGAFERLHHDPPAGRQSELLIVGDGPLREALEQRLNATSGAIRQSVTFAGAVPPDDVPRWLAAMDVGVAPYPGLADFYFSPLKVIEYMAAGLPVVASRVGDLPQLQEAGAGILCPPDDPLSLAGAIRRLMLDPWFCRRLGEAGRRIAHEQYTWSSVARRVLELAGLAEPAMPRTAGEAKADLHETIQATLAHAG